MLVNVRALSPRGDAAWIPTARKGALAWIEQLGLLSGTPVLARSG
jgi:hypothetical protein